MNYIFYHITSASLSWNPFIHFLHTIHIIPPPDIVTGWHILCLIYFFMYNTSLNQTRTEISTFLMSLHQLPEGCSSTLFTPAAWPSGFIIGQRARDPTPNPLRGSWHLCAEGPLHPQHTFHWPHCTPIVCTHPESWQMEHYYILYFKSPSYGGGSPSFKSKSLLLVATLGAS